MIENGQVGGMDFDSAAISGVHSAERKLFIQVIRLLLWDYAHYRRERMAGFMKNARYKKYREARHAVYGDDQALEHLCGAVATDSEYLLDACRKAVSDEQICSGYVLGNKMREDDPAKEKGGRPVGK